MSCDSLQWETVEMLGLSVRVLLRPRLSEGIVADTQGGVCVSEEGVAENIARRGPTYGAHNFQAQSGWSRRGGLLH